MKKYPDAVNPKRVGKYPGLAGAGGGFFYDEVLEYRVWFCTGRGAEPVEPGVFDDYFYAFPTYKEAKDFSKNKIGAEEVIALVKQFEHINEPKPGQYVHVRRVRVTEFIATQLVGRKRKPGSIEKKLKELRAKQILKKKK